MYTCYYNKILEKTEFKLPYLNDRYRLEEYFAGGFMGLTLRQQNLPIHCDNQNYFGLVIKKLMRDLKKKKTEEICRNITFISTSRHLASTKNKS